MKFAMFTAAAMLMSGTAAIAQDADGVDVDVTNIDVDVTDVDVTDVDVVDRNGAQDSFDDNRDYNSHNDNSDRQFNDSFDDNSDNDSNNDNSNRTFNDSFDDLSDNYELNVQFSSESVFDDSAIVAETTLSNVVTGVDVDFGDMEDGSSVNNRLTNTGNSFQNYAGMNALNQNTGAAASQNASVTIAVSGTELGVN